MTGHGGIAQTTPSPFELDVDIFEDVEVPNMAITHSYMPSRTYQSKNCIIVCYILSNWINSSYTASEPREIGD